MPAWFAPLAVSAGMGIINNVMGNRSAKRQREEYERRTAPMNREINRLGREGRQVSAEYLNRLRNFDPMAAATQASQAQMNLAMPQIREQIADLRGSQVEGGRLNTGFGFGDQDRLMTQNLEHLNQSMISRAMQAAQMQQQVNSEMGAYGQNARNTYLDASLGRERTRYEQEMANKASQRGMWGNLLGAGIQGAATLYANG